MEVVIALLAFAITALGSAYYRYMTILDVREARDELAAADLAVTLIETWQGAAGASAFDPVGVLGRHLELSAVDGESGPAGYRLLGAYDVTVSGRTYQSTLYWKDVTTDLRELGTAVTWSPNSAGSEESYQLTTYVRR